MDTEIEFLQRLETELSTRAEADARRESAPPPKRPRPWKAVSGFAAALLLLAFAVGAVALSGGSVRENASSDFATVGAAVNGAGGAQQFQGAPAPLSPGNQLGISPGTNTQHLAKEGDLAAPPADGSTAGIASASPAPDLQQTHAGISAGQPTDLSKIIRDGQIAVTIDRGTFKQQAGTVAHIAAVNGGSILSSSTEGGDSGSFTIRIPAANFDKAMVQLAQLGSVDSSSTQGQDVTAQYVDLKAHMKIYLSRRHVLFGLMDKATTIGQSLTLQNQLDQVQLKIDQITGQINYINKQVAESTIKVDLHEPGAASAQSPDTVDNPSLGHAWDRAVQGLLNVIAATLIGLGYLLPLLIVAGIVLLIVRGVRRRRVAADDA